MELHAAGNQNGRPSAKAHFEREDDEVAHENGDGPTKRKRATPAIEEFMERVMNAKESGVLEKRKVTYGTYLVRGEEIQLPSSVKHLKSVHGGDIFLVGTAHVSRSSIEKVVEVIHKVQPQTVLVELCRSRTGILLAQDNDQSFKEGITFARAKEMIQTQGKSAFLHIILLTVLNRVMKKIEVMPGSEFKAAAREAHGIGAAVVLGDRPIDITFKRTWDRLTWSDKLKLLWLLLTESNLDIGEEIIEKLEDECSNTDILTELTKDFTKYFPTLSVPFIQERDQYLTYNLRICQGDVVVGVVGMGHVEGMLRHWEQPIDIKELMYVKPSSSWKLFFLKVGAVLLFIFAIFYYLFL